MCVITNLNFKKNNMRKDKIRTLAVGIFCLAFGIVIFYLGSMIKDNYYPSLYRAGV